MIGRNINLFLIDGIVKGRIKCSIANWIGVGYKIPRTELEKCKNINSLTQCGIYFLFGSNNNDENIVYVGQSDNTLERLKQHKKNNKINWIETIVFTTTNNSLGHTEISYLENRFYNILKETNRSLIENSIEPTISNVTEEKQSELEEFINYAKIVMSALGYKILEPLIEENTNNDDLELFLERTIKETGFKVQGAAKLTSEGIVVLKGSILNPDNTSKNISDSLKKLRQKHLIDGTILQKDTLFGSSSQAAMFIIGNSSNGRIDWKTKGGVTLKHIEEKEIQEV